MMRPLLRFARYAVVLPPLLLACGADRAPSPAEPAPPIAADAYCEATADAYCQFYLRCGRMAVADAAACVAVFLETCNSRYEPGYLQLVDAGLLTLSSDAVRGCVAQLQGVACDQQLHELDGVCGQMWQGSQPAGAACGFDIESLTCADGTRCILGLDLCGTCTAVAQLGEACASSSGCEASSRCIDGVCSPRRLVGESCDAQHSCVARAYCDIGICLAPAFVGEGAPCDQVNRCMHLTVCLGGLCRRGALQGERCDATTPCVSGRCSAAGLCVDPSASGAPCGVGSDCQSGLCSGGLCGVRPSACF